MMPVVGVAGSFRGRRWLIRVFGWLGLAVVVPVLAACGARSLERPEIVPEPTETGRGPVVLNRDVDLLFRFEGIDVTRDVQIEFVLSDLYQAREV